MILEEQRFLHEDLERLEQGIADRIAEEPKQVSLFFQDLLSYC
jgi:splicing factor 3A subunit 3